MADAARRRGLAPEAAPEGSTPATGAEESRIWTDPRSGERWSIRAETMGDRGRGAGVLEFRRDGRRYRVGYYGESPLAAMDDTELVLLIDSVPVPL